jgi:ubiquitin-conjugating enzyme E2 W
MAARAQRRVQKELERFLQENDGFDVTVLSPNQWRVTFNGPAPLYVGEVFILRITFGDEYPMDSPEVIFIPPNVPQHPHIYSNGHICLNILGVVYIQYMVLPSIYYPVMLFNIGTDWSPALTANSICMSIVSMLSSNTVKCLPPDNERYIRTYSGRSPKDTSFFYHDDSV